MPTPSHAVPENGRSTGATCVAQPAQTKIRLAIEASLGRGGPVLVTSDRGADKTAAATAIIDSLDVLVLEQPLPPRSSAGDLERRLAGLQPTGLISNSVAAPRSGAAMELPDPDAAIEQAIRVVLHREASGPPAPPRTEATDPDLSLGPFQAAIGLRTQAAIAALAAAGCRQPPPALVRRVVEGILAAAPLPHHRRRGYQLIRAMTSAYFGSFALPAAWRFRGTDVPLGGCRVDLWWETDTGLVVIDELKAGRGGARPDPDDDAQARRYVALASATLGGRLVAVRLIVLGPPTRGFTYRPAQGPLVAEPIDRSAQLPTAARA